MFARTKHDRGVIERCVVCMQDDCEDNLQTCACGECDLVLHRECGATTRCEGCYREMNPDCVTHFDGMLWCSSCLKLARRHEAEIAAVEAEEAA